jgi:hypothetical protein
LSREPSPSAPGYQGAVAGGIPLGHGTDLPGARQ